MDKSKIKRLERLERKIKPREIIRIYRQGIDGIIRDDAGNIVTEQELEEGLNIVDDIDVLNIIVTAVANDEEVKK